MIIAVRTPVLMCTELVPDPADSFAGAQLELEVDTELQQIVSVCPLVGDDVGRELPLWWLRAAMGAEWAEFERRALKRADDRWMEGAA
jgi:hypothetical protein